MASHSIGKLLSVSWKIITICWCIFCEYSILIVWLDHDWMWHICMVCVIASDPFLANPSLPACIKHWKGGSGLGTRLVYTICLEWVFIFDMHWLRCFSSVRENRIKLSLAVIVWPFTFSCTQDAASRQVPGLPIPASSATPPPFVYISTLLPDWSSIMCPL